MRFDVLFVLIASCLYLTLAQVSYDDCCLTYVKRLSKGTQKMAMTYRRQEADGGCNIPAIVFTMKRGRVLCTDPRQEWVSNMMRMVDNRNLRNSKKKHGRRGPKRG